MCSGWCGQQPAPGACVRARACVRVRPSPDAHHERRPYRSACSALPAALASVPRDICSACQCSHILARNQRKRGASWRAPARGRTNSLNSGRPCLCRHSWRAPVGPRQWLLNTQSSAPCRRSQGPHGTVQEARNVCEGGGRWSLTQTGFTCAAVCAICVRGGLMAHGVIRFTAYVCCLSKSTLARPVHLLLHLGSAVALGVHPSVHCVSFE